MYTGLLVATGTLDVQQFWPNGTSDADTANIIVSAGAFQFSPTGKTQDLKSTPPSMAPSERSEERRGAQQQAHHKVPGH